MNFQNFSLLFTLSFMASTAAVADVVVETVASGFPGSGGVSVGPDGNIYVSDYGPNLSQSNGTTIWKITPDGERSAFVTGLSGASGSDFDSQGNLFQSHLNGGTIRRITPDGQMTVYSSGHSGPIGVAVNSLDEVFVANCGNNSIRKAVPNGGSTQFVGGGLMSCPNGLTADADDNLYTVNFNNSNMLKITPAGQVTQFAVIPGGGNGHVRYHDGMLYTVSWQGNRVYRVSLEGEVTVLAGTGVSGRQDGLGEQASFFRPNGIDLSADGNIIYLNDTDAITATDQVHPNSLRAVHLNALTELNPGIIGSWYDPATDGSGFIFDLVGGSDGFFGAWYTYVTAETEINTGENDQRWYTIQGTYSGNVANLEIFQTIDGRLLSPDHPTTSTAVGTATVTFNTCTEADFSFQFNGDPAATSFPVIRLSPDELCASGGLAEDVNDIPVVITYIGNLGVMIQAEDKEVIIDGVLATANLSGWVAPTTTDLNNIANGTGPYQDVEVAALTHGHGDHVSFTAVNTFLSNQANAMFVASTSSGSGNINNQNRVQVVNLPRFQNQQFNINGVPVTVYHTRHFNQFGNDFSAVTNLAYLVELGGRKILHVGDFDYAADNIQSLGLQPGELDAIIMPTFNTLINAANFNLITTMLAPKLIITAHFQTGSLAAERATVLNLLPNAVIFDTPSEQIELE